MVEAGPENLHSILRIRVPLSVVLAERRMPLEEVLNLSPGSVIEFERHHQQFLDLCVNNKPVARGETVTVREKFGLRIREIGDLKERIATLGAF
jgi:flagellar motor switch protein FliN/FliY